MKYFNSKILLFGEHTVLYGSDALLMPFSGFSGKFDFISNNQCNDDKLVSHKILVAFSEFVEKSDFANLFNSSQIASELSKGLYFNSNIPIGYGVGSSGAMVAAFYRKFKIEKEEREIEEVRRILAELESYFHGTSSGLDPLVSYLNKPLHKSNNVNQVDIELSPFNAFIVDTDISRSTQNLVNDFKAKAGVSDFENLVIPAIVKSTNGCIKAILNADFDDFFSNLRELSALQFQHLQEFIPVDYRFLWKKGLNTDGFYLKLCGAGGGGYILGFAKKSSGLPKSKKLIIL
ncbi:MAG: hypothetical protein WC951_04210 [Bacteroidales bacterium]